MMHNPDITKKIPPDFLPHGITILARKSHEGRSELEDTVGSLEELESKDYLKIKRADEAPGKLFRIPSSWIENIDGEGVHLNKSKREALDGMTEVQPAIAYPEDYLLKGGAVSAVTGGHPEEMNEMPADTDPLDEDPVYDGS